MAAPAGLLGARPGKLPAGRSIFELDGEVLVNGRRANRDTLLAAGDLIETGSNGRLVGVVGQDALILRPQSRLELGAAGRGARSLFRLVQGAMLSVFGPRDAEYRVSTPVATIGIRGTGLYLEAEAERSYVCLCYGKAYVTPNGAPTQAFEAVSQHHDMPKYILPEARDGSAVQAAPFINHSDLELMTLEALVGRQVPFAVADDPYQAPRRKDY
ncbi:MAG: FecR family protein [Stagnimonas sp.]|nr:FecR family protein [Stagnimonas sp.]